MLSRMIAATVIKCLLNKVFCMERFLSGRPAVNRLFGKRPITNRVRYRAAVLILSCLNSLSGKPYSFTSNLYPTPQTVLSVH